MVGDRDHSPEGAHAIYGPQIKAFRARRRRMGQLNAKVYQQLLELERQPRPCLLTLPETVVAAKTIQRVDDRSASMPTVRVISAGGEERDIPLRLIEGIDIPA